MLKQIPYQINYDKLQKLKHCFINISSMVGGATAIHLVANVIPGLVMDRTYQAAKAGAEAGLGPLAPFFANSIHHTALVASAEVYTKLKSTGYFGWTFSACSQASAVGVYVGHEAAVGLCKVTKYGHDVYVEKAYHMSYAMSYAKSVSKPVDLNIIDADDVTVISYVNNVQQQNAALNLERGVNRSVLI